MRGRRLQRLMDAEAEYDPASELPRPISASDIDFAMEHADCCDECTERARAARGVVSEDEFGGVAL